MNDTFEFAGREFDALDCNYHSPNQDDDYRAGCQECSRSAEFGDLPRDESGYYVTPPWCPRGGPSHGLVHINRRSTEA